MSDQPRRKLKPVQDDGYEVIDPPDAGYEVIDPPPAAKLLASQPPVAKTPPIARRVVAKPIAPPPPRNDKADEDDWGDDDWEDDDRPRRKRPKPPPHWFFRYVINLRGAIAFGVLMFFLTVAGVAMWLTSEPSKPQAPDGQTNWYGKTVPPASRSAAPSAPDIGPAPAVPPRPAGWQEYTDHLGTFVVRVPDGAVAASTPVKKQFGSEVQPRGVQWEKSGIVYYLVVAESWPPKTAPTTTPNDAVTDSRASGLLNLIVFYVDWMKPFWRSGQPHPVWLAGRRAAAISYQSTDEKQVIHLRAVNADGSGYYLGVVGPKELTEKSPEVASFFDGFQLTPGATPAPGATAPPMATPPTTKSDGNRPTTPKKGRK